MDLPTTRLENVSRQKLFSLGPVSDEANGERERREARSEERTIVLCLEIENSGESGARIGFLDEIIDVNVGGDGVKATLIGWGDDAFKKKAEMKMFPLQVGPMESRMRLPG